ncbi:hypothetical protein ALP68_200147 [Pseudomonas ficuserectae]|nr:Uncharacterized protein ALO69_00595 [Pseudomonas ficuserectae]RMS31769.1 hypothetical protein ALP68_200147 [Pseudomonas ficuserectae]
MTKSIHRLYYASHSYSPDNILRQSCALKPRTILSGAIRLPWSSTQEAVPIELMKNSTPESMRFWQKEQIKAIQQKAENTYAPAIFESVDLHQKYDQERFRFTQLPLKTQLWLFMQQGGKWSFIILLPMFLLVSFLGINKPTDSAITLYFNNIIETFPILMAPWLVFWVVGHIVINHFPRLWFRPPKGPLWELNRRTGLITIFGYKRHRKEGVIDEFIAPFYEFDAYMTTTHDRHGCYHGLMLQHRYEEQCINFHALLGPDDFQQRPCALWDFLQNYMDTSGPIPDIPLFEPYRHLDPVTASYDQQRGRRPQPSLLDRHG